MYKVYLVKEGAAGADVKAIECGFNDLATEGGFNDLAVAGGFVIVQLQKDLLQYNWDYSETTSLEDYIFDMAGSGNGYVIADGVGGAWVIGADGSVVAQPELAELLY